MPSVVGSGAAGLRAAVELKRRQQNVLIATAGLYMGDIGMFWL